jgi:hypothetical protein
VAVSGLAHEWKAAIRAMRIGARGRFAVAVRAATALALPLALGVGLGHPAEGAVAAFGALAAHPVQQARRTGTGRLPQPPSASACRWQSSPVSSRRRLPGS